jgi:hypothetical protein
LNKQGSEYNALLALSGGIVIAVDVTDRVGLHTYFSLTVVYFAENGT